MKCLVQAIIREKSERLKSKIQHLNDPYYATALVDDPRNTADVG